MRQPLHPRPPVTPEALNPPASGTMWTNLGEWSAAASYPHAAEALARRVGEGAALTPQDVVVDYACGYGDSLRLWIAAFGVRRAVGVEPDPEVCRIVRRRIADWGLGDRIRIVEARAEALRPRIADADASAVVCVDAAYHFGSRAAWWRMLAEDLPAGARIAASDLVLADGGHPDWTMRVVARAMHIPAANLMDGPQLATTLRALGLVDVRLTPLGAAVLDGFRRRAPASSLRVRVTQRAIGWLRHRPRVDYAVLQARCQRP